MSGSLNKDLNKRLEKIRDHVEGVWDSNTGIPWYTFHDASHSRRVEEVIYSLIPADRHDRLSQEEWFYLLAAAWLHDIGMILNLFGPAEDFKMVRDTHHERSAQYVMEKRTRDALGLDRHEASLIAEICRYHRKKLDIRNCEAEVGNLRLRLLAAYLRLADALHIDKTRTNEARYELLLAAGMPWESRFHWMKSMWVHSIIPEPDDLRIRVSVLDTESSRRGLLAQLVGDEIREELDSVRDVLIRGGISYFLDVDTRVVSLTLDEDVLIEWDLVMSNLELENLSSATDVANSIINTVIRLAEFGPDSYEMIREYCQQLNDVLQARPCHIMIQTVLEKTSRATQEDDLDEEARRTQVERIKADLESYRETRQRNVSTLAENARPLLSDAGSILLFGYSSLVLEALKRLSSSTKEGTQVYIAECRGKTQYSHTNEVIYCDGLSYAVRVKEAGFTHVAIVPDICVANLMLRRLIDKVVFGANGIGSDGRFGHTSGHLAIAELARVYEVPVYVIADTAKFGNLRWYGDLERDISWLTRDQKSLKLLHEYSIRTINPREDIVKPESIDLLVTELGAFPPTRIPASIKRRLALGQTNGGRTFTEA
jgi:translation initiation factor 2B subunit (eIF-2B alpha/beta/delta family)